MIKKEELKVGERVTITLEAVEEGRYICAGCIFDDSVNCEEWRKHYPCSDNQRSDGKNIVFKKVKE